MIKSYLRKKHYGQRRLLGAVCATALSAIVCPLGSHAQVAVPSSVNFDIGTGIYTYSYSVTNNGPTFDLAIINVPVGAGSNPMNLISPSGFGISFDPGVGIVSFFEDADPGTLPTFAPATTKGVFTFTSPRAPIAVTFDALDAGGNSFTGTTMSPVPEPGILSLLGATLLAPAFFARRRRNASQRPTTNSIHN